VRNSDLKYESYRHDRCLQKHVEDPLKASRVDLTNCGGLEELRQFQEYLSDYKIVVYDGLRPDRVIFSGNSPSAKKLYLLYDYETGHDNVITNVKAAMAKKYMCTVVTAYMTTHTNVTKPAPCVLLHHPVLKIRPSIVLRATGTFSVRNAFGII
jgi:hypothetical protein